MRTSNNLFDISGRLALVTGSSRGLGRSLAIALAQAGTRVLIHGRDFDAIRETQKLIEVLTGSVPPAVSFDVTDAEAVGSGTADMMAEYGVPDILINNAGVQRRAPFNEFPVEDWNSVMDTNLSSAFYVSRFIAPAMSERGSGKIINVGSVQSQLARETIAPYSASKSGIVGLTKGMAADLARYNIQVNALSPGYFATEMNTDLVNDESFNDWLVNRTPARRWGVFEELWGTLIYLASDASSFVSGQNLFVDGGMPAVV